jgi:hypothetical protein
MASKLLTEMQSILGHEIVGLPAADPSPREVVGTFVVYGSSVIDEAVWEKISELKWEEVIDTALLSTIEYTNFHKLTKAYYEGSSYFRETWNELSETGEILPEVDRSTFLSVINTLEHSDAQARYVYWCARALQEASDKVKAKAIKRSNKFNDIIPAGSIADQTRETDATQKYMTPHNSETDRPEASQEIMRNAVFHGQDDSKAPLAELPKDQGMERVVKAQDIMTKIANDQGLPIDMAFPLLFRDLAKERARNS